MEKGLRRIRAAVGMGLTWAAAWFAVGIALVLAFPGAADVPFPILWAGLAFVGGVVFSTILGLSEGRRRFDQMSFPRFAIWGGVGGLVLSLIFVLAVALAGDTTPLRHLGLLGPVFVLAGAVSAGGSLALARMASEPELLDAGTDLSELGSAEDERLLGGD